MKKVLTGVLGAVALALILATSSMTAYASDIRVRLNGEYVDIYPAPFIEDGRTLVPARAIAEMLGAIVEWDEENRQVSIEYGDIDILLTIDSNVAVVNGADAELDVPAMLINGRTFVPLRFVAERLGVRTEFEAGVVWMVISNLLPCRIERTTYNLLHWRNVIGCDGLLDDWVYIFPCGYERIYVSGEHLLLLNNEFLPVQIIEYNDELFISIDIFAKLNYLNYATLGTLVLHDNVFVTVSYVASLLNKNYHVFPGYRMTGIIYPYFTTNNIPLADNPVLALYEDVGIDGKEVKEYLRALFNLSIDALEDYLLGDKRSVWQTQADWLEFVINTLRERTHNLQFVKQIGYYALFLGPYVTLWNLKTDDVYFSTYMHTAGFIWRADWDNERLLFPMNIAD